MHWRGGELPRYFIQWTDDAKGPLFAVQRMRVDLRRADIVRAAPCSQELVARVFDEAWHAAVLARLLQKGWQVLFHHAMEHRLS